MALKIDQILGTGIKECGGRLYRHLLVIWSPVRRILDPMGIKLRYMLGIGMQKDLCLHLGCGSKHFDGYVNVGLWITDATDIICDITHLPWPDNSVYVIENYHVFEHISHTKTRQTLAEWYRVLEPNGVLILECPHFVEASPQSSQSLDEPSFRVECKKPG